MTTAHHRRLVGVSLLLAGSLLAACGASEAEREAEREAEAAGDAVCEGDAVADIGLPDDFPSIDELSLVTSEEQGPSLVADGWFDGEIRDAHDATLAAFETAGYKVTFDEIERDDAEVAYESPDGTSTGLVALRAECGGESPIAVHITNRPAG